MASQEGVPGSGKLSWYHRRGGVLVLLFLVLGPLGLPFLYGSPQFNRTWKIILTVLVMVYTFYVIYGSIEVARRATEVVTGFGVSPF